MYNIIYRQSGRDDLYKIWHEPENNMFILIQSGTGSIVSRDRSFPMRKGTLCFIGRHKNHYTLPDRVDEYIRSKIFISSEIMAKLFGLLSEKDGFKKSFGEQQLTVGELDDGALKRAEEIFSELYKISPESPYREALLCSALLELMTLILKGADAKPQVKFSSIERAVEYINLHVTEDVTVDRICSACYLSKYYFCRLFKEKIGLTVMEYVLKTRSAMAKELLTGSDMSVTEVSERCGFSSISYFSRAFKDGCGMSPLQYRKKGREGCRL